MVRGRLGSFGAVEVGHRCFPGEWQAGHLEARGAIAQHAAGIEFDSGLDEHPLDVLKLGDGTLESDA